MCGLGQMVKKVSKTPEIRGLWVEQMLWEIMVMGWGTEKEVLGFPDSRSVSSSSWEKPQCWARALVRSGSQEGRLRPLQLPRLWGGAAGRRVDGRASPPRCTGAPRRVVCPQKQG